METHLLHQVPSELSDTSIPCRGGFIYGTTVQYIRSPIESRCCPYPTPSMVSIVASGFYQDVATVEGHTLWFRQRPPPFGAPHPFGIGKRCTASLPHTNILSIRTTATLLSGITQPLPAVGIPTPTTTPPKV